jgi:dihydrofolate reductase
MGHQIIMGRRTWETLPKQPLPGRVNIVVSTILAQAPSLFRLKFQGMKEMTPQVFPALEPALKWAHQNRPDQEVFIIGGGQLYKYALENDLVDRIVASIIPGQYEGDTFFPKLEGWEREPMESHEKFCVWEYRKR